LRVDKEFPMTTILRAIVPLLLLVAGAAALMKGVLSHPIPVLIESETQKTVEVPNPALPVMPPDGPVPPDGPPSPDGQPPMPPEMPFGMPATIKKTITVPEVVSIMISEPQLIRDVSIGGVRRETTGEYAGQLKRTYSGEAGPALCPS
jgi:hypothetical protein